MNVASVRANVVHKELLIVAQIHPSAAKHGMGEIGIVGVFSKVELADGIEPGGSSGNLLGAFP